MRDLINRQTAIDSLEIYAEMLRRVLDDMDVVRNDRDRFEWGLGLIESLMSDMKELPSAESEILRCKDCKHRDEDECPMRYVEWVTYEEDGYFESDDVVHDRTLDDGFCDRWEKDDTDE